MVYYDLRGYCMIFFEGVECQGMLPNKIELGKQRYVKTDIAAGDVETPHICCATKYICSMRYSIESCSMPK
jgi:hypothetical protein